MVFLSQKKMLFLGLSTHNCLPTLIRLSVCLFFNSLLKKIFAGKLISIRGVCHCFLIFLFFLKGFSRGCYFAALNSLLAKLDIFLHKKNSLKEWRECFLREGIYTQLTNYRIILAIEKGYEYPENWLMNYSIRS